MTRSKFTPEEMQRAGLVRKGVQFDIEPDVWEKFKWIASQDYVSVAELVVQLVRGECAKTYSPFDGARGLTYPHLIGGDPASISVQLVGLEDEAEGPLPPDPVPPGS